MNFTCYEYHILRSLINYPQSIGQLSSKNLGYITPMREILQNFKNQGAIEIDEISQSVSITDKFEKVIKQKEEREIQLIQKSIFENYDFALIQFLFNRGERVYIDDFPEILKAEAPKHGNSINDGNLFQSLFRLKNKINNYNNNSFELNENGKAFFEFMLSKHFTAHQNALSSNENYHFYSPIKNFNKKINNMKIQTKGDGNLINTGNNVTINSSFNIEKGDLGNLIKELEKLEVDSNDISEVTQIINNETFDEKEKKLPPSIFTWIGKVFGKSLEVGGKIATSGAGNVLATLFKQFYGIEN